MLTWRDSFFKLGSFWRQNESLNASAGSEETASTIARTGAKARAGEVRTAVLFHSLHIEMACWDVCWKYTSWTLGVQKCSYLCLDMFNDCQLKRSKKKYDVCDGKAYLHLPATLQRSASFLTATLRLTEDPLIWSCLFQLRDWMKIDKNPHSLLHVVAFFASEHPIETQQFKQWPNSWLRIFSWSHQGPPWRKTKPMGWKLGNKKKSSWVVKYIEISVISVKAFTDIYCWVTWKKQKVKQNLADDPCSKYTVCAMLYQYLAQVETSRSNGQIWQLKIIGHPTLPFQAFIGPQAPLRHWQWQSKWLKFFNHLKSMVEKRNYWFNKKKNQHQSTYKYVLWGTKLCSIWVPFMSLAHRTFGTPTFGLPVRPRTRIRRAPRVVAPEARHFELYKIRVNQKRHIWRPWIYDLVYFGIIPLSFYMYIIICNYICIYTYL